MACDLWGPSFPKEASSPVRPGWQYDFYFGYGFDMIEEHALNEKSCIQVLRILIKKADTEIDELEKDLVLLQSELAWAEHEEWRDICCNGLRAKINFLDISIRKLRNKDENDLEVYLLMSTEPAEKLHEIVKALLKNFCPEENEQKRQPQGGVVVISSCGSPEQSADLHKNQKMSTSYSDVIAKQEINGPSVIPIKSCASTNPATELEDKKGNDSETSSKTNVKDLILRQLALVADQFDEEKIEVVNSLDVETTKKQGTKECGLTHNDKIQHSSSMYAKKSMHNLDRNNVKELAVQVVDDLDPDASSCSAGHLNKRKKLSASSLKIVSEEATVCASISEADISILDSSSNPIGKRANLCKKDEQAANIIAKDLDSFAHNQTTGHSNEMEKLCKHDLKVNGLEVQEYHTINIEKSKISNSCLNHERKGNIPRSDKPANAVVKSIGPGTLRHATGFNGKGNNSDSTSGDFGQAESLNCDMEQKLCDFAVKSARKRGIKELNVASTDNKGPSGLLFKAEGRRKDSLQLVKGKETALSDNKHSALTSLIEVQGERGKAKTILRMDGKPRIEEDQMAEIAAKDDKPVMNLYMRPQRGKVRAVKKNVESTSARIEEPGLNSKENVLSSSPVSKGKRLWKYADNHTLNYNLSGKIVKKTVQHRQCEAEEQNMMLDAGPKTLSLPVKKCKISSSVPIIVEITGSSVQMNISKLHGDLNRSIDKTDLSKSQAIDDSGAKDVMTFDISNLMKMKLCDLRAIARAQKLTRYSALKKEDLVKKLENQLGSQ